MRKTAAHIGLLLAIGLLAAVFFLLSAGSAMADSTKVCGTTDATVGGNGWTQTTTDGDSCNNQNTKHQEAGPVTNKGGGTPGGHN